MNLCKYTNFCIDFSVNLFNLLPVRFDYDEKASRTWGYLVFDFYETLTNAEFHIFSDIFPLKLSDYSQQPLKVCIFTCDIKTACFC